MIEAIMHEIILRKEFLSGEKIHTIYFGGGTPSLMDPPALKGIIELIRHNFSVSEKAEITLEGNPDDLTGLKTGAIREAGINRLSIGIQSFDDPTLRFLNRAHDSEGAIKSVDRARKAGFDNINIDLIFGTRPDYLPVLRKDLEIIQTLKVEHISSYCLTVEDGTVFGNWKKKGKIQNVTDDESAVQYELVIDELTGMGYDHYEISNFALPGFESKHNSSYWRNEKYLGVGPAAHSYNKIHRYANISNNSLYIRSLAENKIPESVDYLSMPDRINEYIMTSIRTKWGCDLGYIRQNFGFNMGSATLTYLDRIEKEGFIVKSNDLIRLTKKGKLIADKIASDMFIP